jgi:hypothetical protein
VGEARASDIRPDVRYHKVIQSIYVNAKMDLKRVRVKVKVKVKVKFALEQVTKAPTGRTNTTLLL